jgi:type I restriction enzyme S subunit
LLVPKLRFKEFKDEWKTYNLKQVLEIKNGLNKEKESFGTGTPIINYMDVNKHTILTSDKIKGLVKLSKKEIDNFKVNKGDIFFTRTSETSAEIGLSSSLIEDIENCVFSGFILKATPQKNIFNNLFSGYYFRTYKLRKEIIKHSSITTRALTSGSLLYGMNIKIPNIDEQEKIGKTLYLLDKKIELQQRRIEALKIYKKGLIQKYFESKSGEKIKISEILEEVINKTTENNQYEVISSTKDGLFLQSEYFNRSIASDNNIGYKILKKNQIVLSPQNLWMGNINYNNKYEIGMVSPSYKIFNINKKFDKDYISNLLKTNKAIYYYTINSEQGASIVRRNLNMESFYEINFVIPDIAEQNKKGKIINEISQKIEKEEKKYQKLDKLKKGLLQKMFI